MARREDTNRKLFCLRRALGSKRSAGSSRCRGPDAAHYENGISQESDRSVVHHQSSNLKLSRSLHKSWAQHEFGSSLVLSICVCFRHKLSRTGKEELLEPCVKVVNDSGPFPVEFVTWKKKGSGARFHGAVLERLVISSLFTPSNWTSPHLQSGSFPKTIHCQFSH